MSHAGMALPGRVADKLGLTRALSSHLAGVKQRLRGHDPGRVIRDLAVMLTVMRRSRIASTPGMLDALRSAHAQ